MTYLLGGSIHGLPACLRACLLAFALSQALVPLFGGDGNNLCVRLMLFGVWVFGVRMWVFEGVWVRVCLVIVLCVHSV